MKTFTVYTKKVAIQLREQGFRIVTTGINKNFPQYDTYIFRDTEEFRKALDKIVNKSK